MRSAAQRRRSGTLCGSALTVVALLAQLSTAGPAAGAARHSPPPGDSPGWQLRWAPAAGREGLNAFERPEEDRAHSHPAGQPHISVRNGSYRFDMHMVDRDISTDRQRQEVRGMRTHGRTLNLLRGETWRFTYSMFIPDTLKATTSFSHIFQTKAPGTGTSPMVVMSLRRHGDVPKLELRATEGNVLVGAVDLAPLQNRWIDIELEMRMADAPDGSIRWVVRDGSTTAIDVTRAGVDTWLVDRVRPKWGIYRSLGDTSGSLQDTYLLIRNLRAYQWSDSFLPPPQLRYEAEFARIHHGTVESDYPGYTGTGFVNGADEAGSYVQWTILAPRAGSAALDFWYANGTTASRPMDITVNGVPIATGLAFDRTPAWDDWETRTLLATLRPGLNTIRATATTAAGGPNLDSLEVQLLPRR